MKIRINSPMLKVMIATALFGASAPISKLLLGEIAPTLMASFLYLGSGIGLFLLRYFRKLDTRFSDEARLTKNDWPWIISAVLVGGIADSSHERTRVCQDKCFVRNGSVCRGSTIFALVQRKPGHVVFLFSSYYDYWGSLFT